METSKMKIFGGDQKSKISDIKRGDVFLANLDPAIGSEQGKTRPVLIIQNDILNQNAPTAIVASITSKVFTKEYPMNVQLSQGNAGLDKNSTVLLSQIRTIDKTRLMKKLGSLDEMLMKKINLAIKISLEIA